MFFNIKTAENVLGLSLFNGLSSYVFSFFNFFFDSNNINNNMINTGLIDQSDFFIKDYYYASAREERYMLEDMAFFSDSYLDRLLDSVFLLKDSVLYNENFFFLDFEYYPEFSINFFFNSLLFIYIVCFLSFIFFVTFLNRGSQVGYYSKWYFILSFFLLFDFFYLFLSLFYAFVSFMFYSDNLNVLLSITPLSLTSYFSEFFNFNVYSNYLLIDTFLQRGNNIEFIDSMLNNTDLFLGTVPTWFFLIFLIAIPFNIFLMFLEGSDNFIFDFIAFVYFLLFFVFFFSISFVRWHAVVSGIFSNIVLGDYGYSVTTDNHLISKLDEQSGHKGEAHWLDVNLRISNPVTSYDEGEWIEDQFLETLQAFYREQITFFDFFNLIVVGTVYNFFNIFFRFFVFFFSLFGESNLRTQVPTYYLKVNSNPENYSSVSFLRNPVFSGSTKPLPILNRVPGVFDKDKFDSDIFSKFVELGEEDSSLRSNLIQYYDPESLGVFMYMNNLDYPGVPYSNSGGKWFFDKAIYQSFFGKEVLLMDLENRNNFKSYYNPNLFKKRTSKSMLNARESFLDVITFNKRILARGKNFRFNRVNFFYKNYKYSSRFLSFKDIVDFRSLNSHLLRDKYKVDLPVLTSRQRDHRSDYIFLFKRWLRNYPTKKGKKISSYYMLKDSKFWTKSKLSIFMDLELLYRFNFAERRFFIRPSLVDIARINNKSTLPALFNKSIWYDSFLNKKQTFSMFFDIVDENESFLYLTNYLKTKKNNYVQAELLTKNKYVLLNNEILNSMHDTFLDYRLRRYFLSLNKKQTSGNIAYLDKSFNGSVTLFGGGYSVNNKLSKDLLLSESLYPKSPIITKVNKFNIKTIYSLHKFNNKNFYFFNSPLKNSFFFSNDFEVFNDDSKRSKKIELSVFKRKIRKVRTNSRDYQFIFKNRKKSKLYITNYYGDRYLWRSHYIYPSNRIWDAFFNSYDLPAHKVKKRKLKLKSWLNYKNLYKYGAPDVFKSKLKTYSTKHDIIRESLKTKGNSLDTFSDSVSNDFFGYKIYPKAFNSVLTGLVAESERFFSDSIKYDLTASEDFSLYERRKQQMKSHSNMSFLDSTLSSFAGPIEKEVNFETVSFGSNQVPLNGFNNLLFPGFYRYGRQFDFSLEQEQSFNKLFLERLNSESFLENFNSYLINYKVDYEVQEHIKERSSLKDEFLYDNLQESFMFFNNSVLTKRVVNDKDNLNYIVLSLRDDFESRNNNAFSEYMYEVQSQLKGRGLLLDESNWFFFKSI